MDTKYLVRNSDGEKLLIKITDSNIMQINREQTVLDLVVNSGISCHRMLDFVELKGNQSLKIYSWLDGITLEEALHNCSVKEQYDFGLEAGKILKAIHSIPVENPILIDNYYISSQKHYFDMNSICDSSIIERIQKYVCDFEIETTERFSSILHGDFHAGNIVANNQKISVIDWSQISIGDAWKDLGRIVVSASICPPFAIGQLNGYFDEIIQNEFWEILKFYIFNDFLGLLNCYQSNFVNAEVFLKKQYDIIKNQYFVNGSELLVPKFYKEGE